MEENKNMEKEVLKELEENLWTYGSPVIFQSGIVYKGEKEGTVELTLTFANIFQKNIGEMNIQVNITDSQGKEEVVEQNLTSLGLDYLESKSVLVCSDVESDAAEIDITVKRIVFEDGTVWVKEDAVYESTGAIDDLDVFAKAKNKDYEDNYVIATEDIAREDYINMNNGIEILKRISWYKDAEKILKDSEHKFNCLLYTSPSPRDCS